MAEEPFFSTVEGQAGAGALTLPEQELQTTHCATSLSQRRRYRGSIKAIISTSDRTHNVFDKTERVLRQLRSCSGSLWTSLSVLQKREGCVQMI